LTHLSSIVGPSDQIRLLHLRQGTQHDIFNCKYLCNQIR
jgi:hypothetical protein